MNSPFQVRLLVFSGRPDPEWALDEGVAEKLIDRLRRVLHGTEWSSGAAGSLGYRGFLVRSLKPVEGIPKWFTVNRHVLTTGEGKSTRYWKDTAGVEELLLDEAREQGLGQLISEFGGPTAVAG